MRRGRHAAEPPGRPSTRRPRLILVVTFVRQDGKRPNHHNDAFKAQAECRRIEKDFGLPVLDPGDGTAARRPTGAERYKAERRGQEATSRELLREAVRRAVAGESPTA
ncbi:hypothetical protein OG928_36270 (plasmid) [Embleya sp. NBC_00896]|nr:hypothetical protein OG928_36270 [Embleya sp. NBC_00896]